MFSWVLGRIFVGTQKRVRINHGKRAIGVRAIAVRLYAAQENDSFAPFEQLHLFYPRFYQYLMGRYDHSAMQADLLLKWWQNWWFKCKRSLPTANVLVGNKKNQYFLFVLFGAMVALFEYSKTSMARTPMARIRTRIWVPRKFFR